MDRFSKPFRSKPKPEGYVFGRPTLYRPEYCNAQSRPAPAQTYDPGYPVCLQTYGRDGNSIACGYYSLAQCNASASGRAAQCIVNPYFARPQAPAEPHHRRRHGVY